MKFLLSLPFKNMQIVGGRSSHYRNENDKSYSIHGNTRVEDVWHDLETDLYHWTQALRPVQVCLTIISLKATSGHLWWPGL